MSFRIKLFLSIVAAVLATAVVESGVDFIFEHRRSVLHAQMEEQLQRYMNTLISALDLDTTIPHPMSGTEFTGIEALTHPLGRFQIILAGSESLISGQAFSESRRAWATLERHLPNGNHVEVALPRSLTMRIVNNAFLTEVIDLPIFFALAFAVAWLLTRLVMKPVRKLTAAFEQISTQQFPEPIPVPDNSDELSQMARSFNRMSKEIQGLLERERTFTRYASHELRTPLSTIKLQIDRAEMGLAPPETVMPVLKRQVQRMEETLSTLLALARSAERDLKPTPLRPFMHDVLATLAQDARARVTLHDKAQDHLSITDARLVFQALGNLLENALRYSSGPVALWVEARGNTVTFSVADSGPGVPEELLDKLTKPFFRAGRHSKSLGLGLSLVENVARSLKGSLELKNAQPGFEAVLTLPIVAPEKAASKAEQVVVPQAQAKRSRHNSTTSFKSG